MEKIVIMVLITLTMGQAKDDLDTMKEMMAEMKKEMMAEMKMEMMAERKIMVEMKMELMAQMNEHLSLAEGKLAKTEDKLTATKDDLAITKKELVITKDDLAITKDDLAITKDDLAITKGDLAVTKDDLAITKADHALTKARTDELEREVAILKAPPYIHSCGSNSGLVSGSSGTIPYTSLLYSSTNTEGGGLDISTGVFTAPHGGSYTVYWDASAGMDSGEYVYIYLQKNGENIEESRYHSGYTGPSGRVYEQGGRTIIVYLGVGDTLQLYWDAGTGEIGHTTFCVSLTTPDIV